MPDLDELLDTTATTILELNERIRECALGTNAAGAREWAEALSDTARAYETLADASEVLEP